MKKGRIARIAVIALCLFGSIVLMAPRAAAQTDVRGQIMLPDGNLPTTAIRFYLTSSNGSVNEIRYTDSNGRFILERLNSQVGYTISLDSDGVSYGATRY